MWKLQHENGRREINELHVPVNQPIKLTMASQDVIHSFYVPAFRMKMDVVPGKYTTQWFKATRTGVYHLFCAEYCGTQHSGMIGRIVVLSPVDYEKWMEGRLDKTGSMSDQGQKVFTKFKCDTCHTQAATSKAPTLKGLFGKTVKLKDGSEVKADEAYLRESVVKPHARIVDGYDTSMPTFQGQITEEEVLQVIAYIKSLGQE
jgi:cytochrome c oxidase subunit 2